MLWRLPAGKVIGLRLRMTAVTKPHAQRGSPALGGAFRSPSPSRPEDLNVASISLTVIAH